MNRNRLSGIALFILVILVSLLVYITLDRKEENAKTNQIVKDLQAKLENLPSQQTKVIINQKPVEGVDYKIPEPIPGPKGDSIQGQKGDSVTGPQGDKGDRGESAYEIAKRNGFNGTEQEWLESLKPKPTPPTDVDLQCLMGLVAKKLSGDDMWQITNIKCEKS